MLSDETYNRERVKNGWVSVWRNSPSAAWSISWEPDEGHADWPGHTVSPGDPAYPGDIGADAELLLRWGVAQWRER